MQLPNHTQLSNEIIDHYMPELSGSEFKCLVAIARKTIGWHKESDKISLSQLEEMTGLARQTVINATESLEKSSIITISRSSRINEYDINYDSLKNGLVQKLDQEESKNKTSDSPKIRHTKDTNTKEKKDNSNIPELQEVITYFTKNGYTKEAAEKFYNYYQISVEGTQKQYWRDSKGNKVRNWKQKAQAVWFKPENEKKEGNKSQFRPDAIHL